MESEDDTREVIELLQCQAGHQRRMARFAFESARFTYCYQCNSPSYFTPVNNNLTVIDRDASAQ